MTKVRCWSEDPSFVTPEAIGMVVMLRLVLELCTAKVCEVATAGEEKAFVDLEVLEVMNDKTSIVFVVVTSCGEAVVETTEAVIVVEAIGDKIEFAPFRGGSSPGPGCAAALGRTGGAGGNARASSGRLKIPKIAVPIPRMSRI